MKCIEKFNSIYHKESLAVSFCPYRISPLGAHVDHQLGVINGLAINKGIHIACGPKQNGVIELASSAAVIISFLSALCKVNNIHLEPMEMPGRRYDIDNLESYRNVEEEYQGIIK